MRHRVLLYVTCGERIKIIAALMIIKFFVS